MGAYEARRAERKRANLDQHPSAVFEKSLWHAQVCSCKVKGSTFLFDLDVRTPDGLHAFSVSRTLEEFQRAHDELKDSLTGHDLRDFPDAGGLSGLPPASMKARAPDFCAKLQGWLDEVMDASLLPKPASLQNLLGLPSSLNLWAAPGTPSLTMLVECHQPLLLEIASYVAGDACDLANFACRASRGLSQQLDFAGDSLWGLAFAARWPAFHECLSFQRERAWKESYHSTLRGKRHYLLEVFDREKKLGFAMAAMSARITYDRVLDSFVARYISASEVLPEVISACESHRIRFCPPSARAQLQPGPMAEAGPVAMLEDQPLGLSYPYRVLEGHGDLVVGQGVELQWKMQYGSPFGWWYGCLERLQTDPDGRMATATLIFRHFPSTSRWYRLQVRLGDARMQPCAFGGFTGGLRPASAAESKHWMRFFPSDPVIF